MAQGRSSRRGEVAGDEQGDLPSAIDRGVTHVGDMSPPKFELGGTQYTLSPPKNNKYYG